MKGRGRTHRSRQPQLLAGAVPSCTGASTQPQGCAQVPLAASRTPTLDGVYSASLRPGLGGETSPPAVPELGKGGRLGVKSLLQTRLQAQRLKTPLFQKQGQSPWEGRRRPPSAEGSRAGSQPLVFTGMLLSGVGLQDTASWPRRPWVEMTHQLHVTPQLPSVPQTHFGGQEVFILGRVFVTPADVFLLMMSLSDQSLSLTVAESSPGYFHVPLYLGEQCERWLE